MEFSKEKFEELCRIQCTTKEICAYFNMTEFKLFKILRQEYDVKDPRELINIYKDVGKMDIRKAQFEQAKTTPVMSLWLGKQYLGQKDVVENNNIENIIFKDDVKK